MNKMPLWIVVISAIFCSPVFADGSAIDTVYHPYVQPTEREVEWRMIAADGDFLQLLGFGKSLSDSVFVEGYVMGKEQNDNFSLYGYEVETRIQLTEQGEYAIDWGVMIDLEKEAKEDIWEMAATLLMEKEWGRWVGAANLKAIYEWGNDIKNELESALALQARYRLSREFEPGIEFYSGQITRAVGPVVMGDVRFGGRKRLHWETGVLLGLDHRTPDATLRMQAEYEF